MFIPFTTEAKNSPPPPGIPSWKREKTKVYYKLKRNCSPRRSYHSIEITSQSTLMERLQLRQRCVSKWLGVLSYACR